MGERYMMDGDHPTLKRLEEQAGGTTLPLLWLSKLVRYACELCDTEMPADKLRPLVEQIHMTYKGYKLTELMHFAYMFRGGEVGKVFGKATPYTIISALKEFSAVRNRIRGRLWEERNRQAEGSSLDDTGRRCSSETVRYLAEQIKANAELGAWRREPWADLMSRAYFVDHTLTTYPGDMTEEERREWAEMRTTTSQAS